MKKIMKTINLLPVSVDLSDSLPLRQLHKNRTESTKGRERNSRGKKGVEAKKQGITETPVWKESKSQEMETGLKKTGKRRKNMNEKEKIH